MERNKHFGLAAAVFALALTLPLVARAKVIYVDDDANGLNNGTSWFNAYRFLYDAMADAKAKTVTQNPAWAEAHPTERLFLSMFRSLR